MKTHGSPFPTTHWTMVHAVQEGTPEEAARAMEAICRDYWFPIYAYLRRCGNPAHFAEDMTQALFEKVISDEAIRKVRRDRGKLRSYLLGMLLRLLSDQSRHARAAKRGGGEPIVSFDEMEAEERYAREPRDLDDPEKIFAHAWAVDLLERVHVQLRQAFEAEGRLEVYETLQPWLSGDDAPPYEELAAKLGKSNGAARLVVHRLRKTFRDLLEREVAKTVLNPDEVEEELAWLRKVLAE